MAQSRSVGFCRINLLSLPIPPIFVATNENFDWEVVDGVQRISTLILFLSEDADVRKRVAHEDSLQLKGLEKLTQLNGKTHADLPLGSKRYFARQPLQVIALTDKSDKTVRFDLFERLNTGSISLTPQEVRAAVYEGHFIDFVDELSSNTDLNALLKLQEANKQDGTTAEQVLKFFAYKNDQSSFRGAVTNFLNEYIVKTDATFEYAEERAVFEQTARFLAGVVGGPFLRRNTPITPLVQFEACMIGISRIIETGANPVEPGVDWLNDPELVASSTGGTNTRSMLERRVNRAQAIFSGEA